MEPSKTPLYIVGALFVVFAVLIAVVGITRPDFPGTLRARLVMVLTLALAGGTLAAAVATA